MKKLINRIRSYFSILVLSAVLVNSFRKGIKAVLFREEKEAGYLSHDQFDTCLSRAKAIIMEAVKNPLKILALAIAFHREKFHGEDHSKEINDLSRQMTDKEVKLSTQSWWHG